jgi:drug/metabolite transporter (DMT)-like permease
MEKREKNKGISAAIASAVFLGLAPILGKQAMLFGFSPLAVVAFRTGLATIILFLFMLIFQRQFLYIYPLGLAGCLLAGLINGVASIFYYGSLSVLDASVAQVLYSFYPMFTALWLLVDRQPISKLTIIRLMISLPGVYLLIQTGDKPVNLAGAGMMLLSAILYALHLIINQRIL